MYAFTRSRDLEVWPIPLAESVRIERIRKKRILLLRDFIGGFVLLGFLTPMFALVHREDAARVEDDGFARVNPVEVGHGCRYN